MQNVIGLCCSYLFVGAVLGAAALLQKRFSVSARVTRKIIHISVSNWWFLLMAFFDSAAYAVIGPITFIIINYVSYRYHLIPSMEFEERRKNLGTIYFPISLLILVILSFNGILPLYAAGTGILVMGYGDGLASLFGEQYGKWNFPIWDSRKSYVGTSVMFTATAAVVISMTLLFGPSFRFLELAAVAFVIAAVATFIELITPWGLDNITVPIGTAFLYTLIAV